LPDQIGLGLPIRRAVVVEHLVKPDRRLGQDVRFLPAIPG
jgi:hypothetical protein